METRVILTVARAVVDQLVAGLARAAERVRQVDADLRTSAVVDQTLVHAARFLFLVLVPGTVRVLVAHLVHGYAHAAGLVVAAVELGERVALVRGFFCVGEHLNEIRKRNMKTNTFRTRDVTGCRRMFF